MPGDYGPQLEEIAKALNRPSIPTWLIAALSAFLGFLLSILNQIFQQWYSEQRALRTMRKIIYSEIGSMYSNLLHFYNLKTNSPEDKDIEWRKKQLRERFLKFEGEKYAEDNKEVFFQMEERSTINDLYSAIHDVFGPEEEYGFFINAGLAIEVIEDCVMSHDLPFRFVKRYINGSDVTAITEANKNRHTPSQPEPL
ncbi:MAG: hypothetical protein ABSE99_05375 [Terracidiphilus sp.]|jgi:hypothetical protein